MKTSKPDTILHENRGVFKVEDCFARRSGGALKYFCVILLVSSIFSIPTEYDDNSMHGWMGIKHKGGSLRFFVRKIR